MSLALRALQNHMTECLQVTQVFPLCYLTSQSEDTAVLDLRVLFQGQESFYGKYIAKCYGKKHSKNNTDSFDKYGKYLSHS